MAKEVLLNSFLMVLGAQKVHIPVTVVPSVTVSISAAMTARTVSGGEMREWTETLEDFGGHEIA